MSEMVQIETPKVPVSWGELIDKITILVIKREEIRNPQALANVEKELQSLSAIAAPVFANFEQVRKIDATLLDVNRQLWHVEDALRLKEEQQNFDEKFIDLARSVYQLNDERARLKRQINDLLSSEFVEEKSYKGFTGIPG
jgi:uncharacterized protein involved in exopolysaccharide biosynthesis